MLPWAPFHLSPSRRHLTCLHVRCIHNASCCHDLSDSHKPPFHGIFFDSSTHAMVGSDLHRFSNTGCATPSGFLNLLTLYSACPLSALFHAVAFMSFSLQRFPLSSSLWHLSMPPALLAVSPIGLCSGAVSDLSFRRDPRPVSRVHASRNSARRPRLRGLMQPKSPSRHRWCYPNGDARSSLGFFPSRVIHPSGLGSASRPAFHCVRMARCKHRPAHTASNPPFRVTFSLGLRLDALPHNHVATK
jgi:hypothetical protein